MKIGIAAPIEINSIKHHLENLENSDLTLGLGGTAVNILIDGFIKQGHQIIVFTLDTKVQNVKILKGQNVKVFIGHFRTSSFKKMMDFCRLEYRQIQKFVESEVNDLDVINAHWSYEFAIGSLLACPEKTIVSFRDDAPSIFRILRHPYRLTRLLMDKWVRKNVQFAIFNSPYLKELINLPGEIIGNPIFEQNIGISRKHPGRTASIRLFFVSNGTDIRKNPHIAVEVFRQLKEKFPHLELHFIGQGYENHEKFAVQYRDIDGVIFHGFQRHSDLLDMMTNYHIMLHTSLEESFGNNIIESMAKGLPVVAGERSGAVPWVLNYGKAGTLVDITNAESIVQGVENLIVDEAFYYQMSNAGVDHVLNSFRQDKVCDAYIKAYNNISQ